MAIARANTLNKTQLSRLLSFVDKGPNRIVDRAKVLLSFGAGLRAQEIVGLRWDRNVLNAVGEFKTQRILVSREGRRGIYQELPILFVGSDIGKYGRERTIVMSPELAAAMKELLDTRDLSNPYVIPAGKTRASTGLRSRANALTVWFHRLYDRAGFDGCSSHSGRRSFITEAARQANLKGCSLIDVQKLAGHADLGTTQRYVDLSEGQANLVTGLWGE